MKRRLTDVLNVLLFAVIVLCAMAAIFMHLGNRRIGRPVAAADLRAIDPRLRVVRTRVVGDRLEGYVAAAEPQGNTSGSWTTLAGLDGLARVALKVAADGTLLTGPDPGGQITPCSSCVVVGGMNGLQPMPLKVGSDGTVAISGAVPSGTTIAGSNITFPGGVNASNLEGVVYADQQTGADASVKIDACITAAIAKPPRVCDARNLGGTQTISQEIDVGDSSQDPVTLILPSQCTWNVSITSGTVYAIKQFSNTVIVGATPGGSSKCVIQPLNSSTSIEAFYTTDFAPTGGGSYLRAADFQIYNPGTITTVRGIGFQVFFTFDNSRFDNITVADYGENGVFLTGAQFSTTFYNLTVNGNHVANSQPLIISTNGGSNNTVGLNFVGGSFDHPGTGKNVIQIIGTGASTPVTVTFDSTYMEGNNTDTTTPLVELQSVVAANFFGVTACTLSTNSTQPVFQLDDSTAIATHFTVTGLTLPVVGSCKHTLPEPKIVLNNIPTTPVNIPSDAVGALSYYATGPSFLTGPLVLGSTSTTSVTASNPTANTDTNLISSQQIAGYFNILSNSYAFVAAGNYSTTAASVPALTFKIKLCTVSGCGSGTVVTLVSLVTTALNTAALTNATWTISMACVTKTSGTSGNLVCKGTPGLTLETGAAVTAADSTFVDTNTATSSNIDLTQALFVQFTVAQSTTGASNSYTQAIASIR